MLSHSSAVALWEFLRPISGPIHVTVGASVRRKPRPGLQIHRSRTLGPGDVTRRHGIAVTMPARTIEDIRGEVEPYLFNRRVHGQRVDFFWPEQRVAVETEAASAAVVADLRAVLARGAL